MRILVAGDSLGLPRPHRINDYSLSEYDLAVSYGDTYSSIINKELLTLFKMDPYIEIINKSKRSQTIAGVYSDFIDNLFFHQPDVIIIHVGIVDCWFRDELGGKQYVPLVQYNEYLIKILTYMSFRDECKLILVGISPTSLKMEERYPGINSEIRSYNEVLRSKVNYRNVFYIDMEKYTNIENIHQYLLLDDHHLNVEGNKLIANELLKILKGIIYTQKGVELEKKEDFSKMNEFFLKGFHSYPYNIDTLYNLIITLYEKGDKATLNFVEEFIKTNKIVDPDLQYLFNSIYRII
ncbi:SGNH/GDSL hydrolase family protein [Lysinibacillus sp. NPDC086135]|uniref:SGNH/GDSL hydrolase family protein n=1 Tax=Lysinibacillus sp. NPDC086135 TaxID=3364130 RepID=UPI00380E3EDA